MFAHNYQHNDQGCGPRGRDFTQHFARFGADRGPGPFGGRGPFGARGFGGGGRERMFDNGEFQLVLLNLLAKKPGYGYELIKTLEQKMAGGYAPSPGVVYPTLTMLEEEGLTTATTDGGRKVYTVTEAGHQHLAQNKQRLDDINARLNETGETFERGNAPDFRNAMKSLQRAVVRVAIRGNVTGEGIGSTRMAKIVAALEAATKTIDEL